MSFSLRTAGQRLAIASVVIGSLLLIPAGAATYYVATTGNDAADGSAGTPFKTIQKAAGLMKAGDVCFIHAGVYRETVTPANSGTSSAPITFCGYGSDSVTISGADPVPGPWTVSSGKIYVTDASLATKYADSYSDNVTLLANQIFVNGEMMPQARWPNLAGTNAANPNFTTDTPFPTTITGGLTGAIAWESSWFLTHTGTVSNADASSVAWTKALCMSADPQEFRRQVMGVIGLLDAEREWHYDMTAKKLYLWAPGGGAPVNVEAKARNWAFDLRGKAYVTIKRITIFASTITTTTQSTNLTLDHITARYVSHYVTNPVGGTTATSCYEVFSHTKDSGILFNGAHSMVLNSRISGSAGNGLMINARGCVIYNCMITDCNYQGSYCSSAFFYADSVRVYHTTIAGMGRDGMCSNYNPRNFFGSEFAFNDISNYGRMVNDVGSIYFCCTVNLTSTSIHHTNTHDMSQAAPGPYGIGAGVYLDNDSYGWCAYQNIGDPAGENHNGSGGPGTCPSNIDGSWPIPAGCNMPGCGAAQGKTLPHYTGIPDSAIVNVAHEVARQTGRPLSGVRLTGSEVMSIYAMDGTLVGSCAASDAGARAALMARLGDGIYCARVRVNGGLRVSRLLLSRTGAFMAGAGLAL